MGYSYELWICFSIFNIVKLCTCGNQFIPCPFSILINSTGNIIVEMVVNSVFYNIYWSPCESVKIIANLAQLNSEHSIRVIFKVHTTVSVRYILV